MTRNSYTCRACGNTKLGLIRSSTIKKNLSSDHFAITDTDYGVSAALYRCSSCGLIQCPEIGDVLQFYQSLEDKEYEDGRTQRYLQAEKLIQTVLSSLKREDGRGLTLLDVGAGSGILVEAAQNYGFTATGIEPSAWLTGVAQSRGLDVHEGVLPHPKVSGRFNVVMLIDVIEHVSDPFELLGHIKAQLAPGGRSFIVTPDVSSVAAHLLGFKWWHYRIAHISYFNKKTLEIIANRAGLKLVSFSRPGWFFTYSYLRERLLQYLPGWILPPAKGPLEKLTIPLNLGDSLLMVCEPK